MNVAGVVEIGLDRRLSVLCVAGGDRSGAASCVALAEADWAGSGWTAMCFFGGDGVGAGWVRVRGTPPFHAG